MGPQRSRSRAGMGAAGSQTTAYSRRFRWARQPDGNGRIDAAKLGTAGLRWGERIRRCGFCAHIPGRCGTYPRQGRRMTIARRDNRACAARPGPMKARVLPRQAAKRPELIVWKLYKGSRVAGTTIRRQPANSQARRSDTSRWSLPAGCGSAPAKVYRSRPSVRNLRRRDSEDSR